MAIIVEADGLRKTYVMGDEVVRALDNVSLRVEAGEFVALMGASGSGKSTLLHLLGGLDRPTAGRIVIEGHDLSSMSDRERTVFRRRRVGVVFQSFNLLPTLTARENVALPLLVDGVSTRAAASRLDRLLETVDLSRRAHHRPQAMSGGEQQRAAIARALVNDPAIVLADEPTGNLDSHHGARIWRLLRRLVDEQERTVLAVTHEALGASYADRALVLQDGKIIGEIQPEGRGDATLVAARYAELAG